MELKVTKANAINISSHQVAWNYAYCMSGGVSFFLVHPLSSPHLYLFGGVHGRELLKSGLRGVGLGSGLGVRPRWAGDNESGLVGSGGGVGGAPTTGARPRSISDPGGGLGAIHRGLWPGVELPWPARLGLEALWSVNNRRA